MDPFFTEIGAAVAAFEPVPNPFDEVQPGGLVRAAAERLQADLRGGFVAAGVPAAPLFAPGAGKMFGVLVVAAPDGRIGFLRAFSGMFAGQWNLPGYVPPLFERDARAAIEPAGEAVVKELHARARAFAASEALARHRGHSRTLAAAQAAEFASMRARHAANKLERRRARSELGAAARDDDAVRRDLHELDQASRADKAERRRREAAHAEQQREYAQQLAPLERRLAALERLRRMVSRRLMQRIHDCYRITNARGDTCGLRELFAPIEPPAGAADCAAPKLLAHAYAHRLRPLALAEFWWGAPPATGGRVAGVYYPACREKCGPLLPFMLQGHDVAAPRQFAPEANVASDLVIVAEDEWLVVVDKPHGLLSVPGRSASQGDSVLQKLRARHPHAAGPLLVHRLDLDTSGLLVAALDAGSHAALQRQFVRREVRKRYSAWVEGEVVGDEGTIELALRVDLNDRPRQIHDPVHGKPAVTEWRVVERSAGRTRVLLWPRTGRTHQLRVHAAHPAGLAAPIIGDRLYGRGGDRLLLHAESLALRHPVTGEWVTFASPAPF